jgi:hypothetical protein
LAEAEVHFRAQLLNRQIAQQAKDGAQEAQRSGARRDA